MFSSLLNKRLELQLSIFRALDSAIGLELNIHELVREFHLAFDLNKSLFQGVLFAASTLISHFNYRYIDQPTAEKIRTKDFSE